MVRAVSGPELQAELAQVAGKVRTAVGMEGGRQTSLLHSLQVLFPNIIVLSIFRRLIEFAMAERIR